MFKTNERDITVIFREINQKQLITTLNSENMQRFSLKKILESLENTKKQLNE
jgi:hypothetical protein